MWECTLLVGLRRALPTAALALAQLRALPVLTTDRAWRALRLAVRVDVIR
jgi:PIN domain nuclease of toxin-antitoxin system